MKWRVIVGLLIGSLVGVSTALFLKAGNGQSPINIVKDTFNETRINGFVLDDTRQHSIPFDAIVSGGVGRDGIPPIDNPKFVSANETTLNKEGLGILTEIEGVQRFYPYAILDWHEIVNDQVNDSVFAVTYCPLCGSASVYDRRIEGEVVRFGVSGLLHESNLLMYDDKTESLWSQSVGKGVVGERNDYKLTRLSTQLVSMQDAINQYPSLQILSTDTGHSRNYGSTPYTGYGDTEQLYFEVSVNDTRLPAKTIMYAFSHKESFYAIQQNTIQKSSTVMLTADNKQMIITKDDSGELFVRVDEQEVLGYFEMWFSWATQHQSDGTLLKSGQ